MRVESKIQEKKIKIFKQGEFVEKSGNIHIPVYKMETKDHSQEDIAERISEIVSSYYLKKCRDNDIDKIFISLYSVCSKKIYILFVIFRSSLPLRNAQTILSIIQKKIIN